jgi:hypothetical protein
LLPLSINPDQISNIKMQAMPPQQMPPQQMPPQQMPPQESQGSSKGAILSFLGLALVVGAVVYIATQTTLLDGLCGGLKDSTPADQNGQGQILVKCQGDNDNCKSKECQWSSGADNKVQACCPHGAGLHDFRYYCNAMTPNFNICHSDSMCIQGSVCRGDNIVGGTGFCGPI